MIPRPILNRQHPQSKNLIFCAVPIYSGGAIRFVDLVTGMVSSQAGSAVTYTSRSMRARYGNPLITGRERFVNQPGAGTACVFPRCVVDELTTQPFTVFIEGGAIDDADSLAGIFASNESGAGNGFRMLTDDSGVFGTNTIATWFNNTNRVGAGADFLGTNMELFGHRFAIAFDGGSNHIFWRWRRKVTAAAAGSPTDNANRRTRIAGDSYGTTGHCASIVAVFLGVLPDEDVYRLCWDPSILFMPVRSRRILFAPETAAAAFKPAWARNSTRIIGVGVGNA